MDAPLLGSITAFGVGMSVAGPYCCRPKNSNACPGDNQHGQRRPIQQHPVPEFKVAVMEMEYRSVAV
jgi:hypothetical protein